MPSHRTVVTTYTLYPGPDKDILAGIRTTCPSGSLLFSREEDQTIALDLRTTETRTVTDADGQTVTETANVVRRLGRIRDRSLEIIVNEGYYALHLVQDGQGRICCPHFVSGCDLPQAKQDIFKITQYAQDPISECFHIAPGTSEGKPVWRIENDARKCMAFVAGHDVYVFPHKVEAMTKGRLKNTDEFDTQQILWSIVGYMLHFEGEWTGILNSRTAILTC